MKCRNIYDYKDIRKLKSSYINADLEERLKKGVIITATASLKEAMSKYYTQYKIIGINELMDKIFAGWTEGKKSISSYLLVRDVIAKLETKYPNNKNIIKSYMKNSIKIWNAIVYLVEAGVSPEDISEGDSILIKLFKDIWTKLECESTILKDFREKFCSISASDLPDALILSAENPKECECFMVGFYSITSIQIRVFEAMEKFGIQVNYLNCHDKKYAENEQNINFFEIWEKTFEDEYKGTVEDIQPGIEMKNYFGDLLYKNQADNSKKVDIDRYSSELEFVQAVKKIPEEADIYTADTKSCKDILEEYYPEIFGNTNRFFDPKWQYIYFLHKMYNTETDQAEPDFGMLYKCFTGDDDLYALRGEFKRIEEYVKDCVTLKDWKKRLENLSEQTGNIRYENKNNRYNRWHELLGNPYSNMSVYNVEPKTLEKIRGHIDKIEEDVNKLFKEPFDNKTKTISIKKHFENIENILFDKDRAETNFDNEKMEFERGIKLSEIKYPIEAVRDAILLLIEGEFDDFEVKIRSLSDVESSTLNKNVKDVYLLLADEFTLPGKKMDLPWPLNNKLLDDLIKKYEDEKKDGWQDKVRYINSIRSERENRPLASRYLFFSFMSNFNEENLHISWIKNKGRKIANASPYVRLIDSEADDKDYAEIQGKNKVENITDNRFSMKLKKPECALNRDIPEVVKYDYAVCKLRYFYSYILNRLPEYRDDFHYGFILSGIIRLERDKEKRKNPNEDTKDIKNRVKGKIYNKFPFLKPVKKSSSSRYVGNNVTYKVEPYDGVEYLMDDVYMLHYLNSEGFNAAKKAYDEDNSRVRKILPKSLVTDDQNDKKGDKCKWCPYMSVCVNKGELGYYRIGKEEVSTDNNELPILSEGEKTRLVNEMNKDPQFRDSMQRLIRNYDEKMQNARMTGEPMVIEDKDLFLEKTDTGDWEWSIDIEDVEKRSNLINQLEKRGICKCNIV